MALIFNNNLLNELFGREFNKISVLPLDVTISEAHSLNQRMTSRPVEGGGTFTDNIIIDPTTLTMSCIVTSSIFGDSWEDKLNTIEQIRRAREPFDVVTSWAYRDLLVLVFLIRKLQNRQNSTMRHSFFDLKVKGFYKNRIEASKCQLFYRQVLTLIVGQNIFFRFFSRECYFFH